MNPTLGVDVSHADGEVVVRFVGELDLAGRVQAHDRVVAALDQFPRGALILDLGTLTYADSSGIHVLLRLQSETRARGREMMLRHVQPAVARVLEVGGVRDQFAIED
jgi:anti-sigma B factor antagonist